MVLSEEQISVEQVQSLGWSADGFGTRLKLRD